MTAETTFLDDLDEIARGGVVVGDLVTEARANMWPFALTQQQAEAIAPQQVLRFLYHIIEARERTIVERFGESTPMVFYCWFDEQVIQLRFSLVSACHRQLPFGCRVTVIDDLARIVGRFLQSRNHDGFPLDEMEDVAPDQDAATPEMDNSDYNLEVWMKRLPSSAGGG